MNNKERIIAYALIIILCLVLICLVKCNRNIHTTNATVTLIKTDTIKGDSIPYVVYVPQPQPYVCFSDTIIHHDIDTVYVLKDYYSKKVYNRIFKDDSSAYIQLIDTVSNNELKQSTFIFQNRKVTTINNTYTNSEKSKLYFGGSLNTINLQKYGIGLDVAFENKNKLYGVTYDPILKLYQIKLLIKLF